MAVHFRGDFLVTSGLGSFWQNGGLRPLVFVSAPTLADCDLSPAMGDFGIAQGGDRTLTLFPLMLAQADAGAAAVLVDELHAG